MYVRLVGINKHVKDALGWWWWLSTESNVVVDDEVKFVLPRTMPAYLKRVSSLPFRRIRACARRRHRHS